MKQDHKNNQIQEEKIIFELIKRGLADNSPSRAFKAALFEKLSKEHFANQSPRRKNPEGFLKNLSNFFRYSSHFPAIVASFFVIVVGLGITSSYAYQNSEITRGDSLYSVKKLIENIDYSLTLSQEGRIEKSIDLANRRKEEFEVTYNKGQIDELTAEEIAKNLNNAFKISADIEDETDKKTLQEKIKASSQDIISDLNTLIQDISDNTARVKIKRVDPTIQEFKQTIENIEKNVQSLPEITPPLIASCADECQPNQSECYLEGYRNCGNFDQDNCTEWSSVQNCPQNTVCESGNCQNIQPSCTNECWSGERICSGKGYQTCGNYDADSCTEWSAVVKCSSGYNCSNGYCILEAPPPCTDECTQDSRQCLDDGFQICGNFDQDNCLEWGEKNECPKDTTCKNGSCFTPPPSCTDECSGDAVRQCANDQSYQICGNYDNDSCFEWGEPNTCPDDTACQGGVCL